MMSDPVPSYTDDRLLDGRVTIRQPVAEMAAAAARRLVPMLRARLKDEDPVEQIIPYSLIVRDSTGPAPT